MKGKEVRFGIDASQDAWLASEAKKAGVPKSKILLQLINNAMGDHAKVNGTSDRIVGVKAKIALLENEDRIQYLKGDVQVLWYDGFIWFVGKTANGSQVQLDRWLEAPLTLFKGLSFDRFGAKDVRLASERWNELAALEFWDKVVDSESFRLQARVHWLFDDNSSFEALKAKALEAIERYKDSLLEPTAVVDVVNDVNSY